MITLRLLLLLTNLHLKLLSTQGTGDDKLLSIQRVNYIYNVENDNALRSHNFSPFFRFSIFTSAHTRCSYGYHAVFRSMTVFFMCLIPIYLLTTIV